MLFPTHTFDAVHMACEALGATTQRTYGVWWRGYCELCAMDLTKAEGGGGANNHVIKAHQQGCSTPTHEYNTVGSTLHNKPAYLANGSVTTRAQNDRRGGRAVLYNPNARRCDSRLGHAHDFIERLWPSHRIASIPSHNATTTHNAR